MHNYLFLRLLMRLSPAKINLPQLFVEGGALLHDVHEYFFIITGIYRKIAFVCQEEPAGVITEKQ